MSCKYAKYEEDENRYNCSVSGDDCVYISPDSKKCAEEYGEGPDNGYEDDEPDEQEIPYTDLWVKLKYTLEMSEYCNGIREKDTSPAFASALCQKCIENKCRFIDICVGLHEMNREDHKD